MTAGLVFGVPLVEHRFPLAGACHPHERVAHLSDHLLTEMAGRYDIDETSALTIPERVKNLRREVIERLRAADEEDVREALRADMDELFHVVQLFSYPGNYVSERPSIERIAETIDKFEEDFLDAPTAGIRGERHAVVTFGEPIPVPATRDRAVGAELTHALERNVQKLLDGSELGSSAELCSSNSPAR